MKKTAAIILSLTVILTCLASCKKECDIHQFGAWKTTKKATCSENGEQERTCTVCGTKEIGTIDMTAHDVDETTGKCKNCGAQISSPKIELTPSNVSEYLSFNLNTEDIVVTKEILGKEKGTGKIRVTANKLQNVSFNNVELTVTLKVIGGGWGSLQNRKIIIPYDGNLNMVFDTFSYIEDYVSKTPFYDIEVTAATGYVTMN